MKILLVAPEICPPWTEGRKRFVRDLGAGLSQDHDVRVLTTTTPDTDPKFPVPASVIRCRWRWQHLTALQRHLPGALSSFQPQLVCHLPYGTFRHLYSAVNLWSMRQIDKTCDTAGLPCFTVMYSISREANVDRLGSQVRHLVLNDFREAGRFPVVRLGLDFTDWPEPPVARPVPSSSCRLLFMAGMWQRTPARLDHVLDVRGLRLLLRAGSQLSKQGMRLTVAVPLLGDRRLQERLRQLSDNTWPPERLTLTGEVSVPDIYGDHDLFVFPYAREEKQFTPTSVLEAMRAGTPVVLPDLRFLKSLADGGRHAYTFRANDVDHLSATVLAAVTDSARYNVLRREALTYVCKAMSIERACDDLLSLYSSLTKPTQATAAG